MNNRLDHASLNRCEILDYSHNTQKLTPLLWHVVASDGEAGGPRKIPHIRLNVTYIGVRNLSRFVLRLVFAAAFLLPLCLSSVVSSPLATPFLSVFHAFNYSLSYAAKIVNITKTNLFFISFKLRVYCAPVLHIMKMCKKSVIKSLTYCCFIVTLIRVSNF